MTFPLTISAAPLTCFKAYDIRGKLGTNLDEAIAHRIGRAFVQSLNARRVVLGRDCRASSESLASAVAAALVDAGVEVLDLGLCGTEEVYFATAHLEACGGIEVTASHNPMDYNGMKLVKAGAAPLDPTTEVVAIRELAEIGQFMQTARKGSIKAVPDVRQAYVERVLGFVDVDRLKPLKVLVNAGNGAAGPTFDAIANALAARGAPITFERMHHEPDGSFPNGIPNPLLPENQPATAAAVRATGADLGVAWDGDFDRCFFFDHRGKYVPGEYLVGLLATAFLQKEQGATIVHDPRVVWNTKAAIAAAGGTAHCTRTGHAFLKQAMRETGAFYGGEMSAHHYFRDFMCCDSGMIPWLIIAELVSTSGQSLENLIAQSRAAFPSSGEVNFRVGDVASAMKHVFEKYQSQAVSVDDLDGLSVEMPEWRFNLRASNTEPLLRLNVETRAGGDPNSHVADIASELME